MPGGESGGFGRTEMLGVARLGTGLYNPGVLIDNAPGTKGGKMAGIGERLKGLLRGENHVGEDSDKALMEIVAMSREDFQEAIEIQLRDLPRPLVVAFAACSASCTVPFMLQGKSL